ncbi:DUF551 domain-containing protein [Escherichia coli]|uniref:DUF551 domain-containing protein n=1 Tax=Escherichia coli TaxID=562 RepID=UPI0007A5C757|nr:DUF551 domain-containing protein [Escherichia coli]EEW8913876.1 DUF551 domain-containing protein [Escherichia coli]
MSTITREWLQQAINDYESVRDELPFGLDDYQGNILAALRIALASLEAEPIGAFHIAEQQVDGTSDYIKDGEWPIDNGIIEVYAAPPVPVVPEEKPMPNPLSMYAVDAVAAIAEVRGWNACRAAMLQGSQPVSQTYKFPVNTPCQDAPAHIWLQTAGAWPEDGELSELTWCSHNQHHDDTLYVRADLVNGNSPVTPDGWISCSERMPKGYADVLVTDGEHVEVKWWDESGYWNSWTELNSDIFADEITHWMPLPEPPQEVK